MNSVMIIGKPQTKKLELLRYLTDDNITVDIPPDSHSGIIQPWNLKTKYYEAELHFWIDEFEDFRSWVEEFNQISDEFENILQIIIFNFRFSQGLRHTKECLNQLQKLNNIDGLEIIGVGIEEFNEGEVFEEFEDLFLDNGFEIVNYNDVSIENEFKEKLGKHRISEILQCHEWTLQKTQLRNDGDRDNEYDNNNNNELNTKEEKIEDILANDKLEFGEFLTKIKQLKLEVSEISDDNEKHDKVMNAIEELMSDIAL